MSRSKRNKKVQLSKTEKRGLDWKKELFEKVRNCVDTYANVFVFSMSDMRSSKIKEVREQWKPSRFFIGNNRIMAIALGRFKEEEYKPNLHKLVQQIKGQCGLLFSNKPLDEVLRWFRPYSEGGDARYENTAKEIVNLSADRLTEPYLRQLGLSTSLVKCVRHLVKDHDVCKGGDTLTPETSKKILKLLRHQMAEFHITINCVWSQDGSFLQLTEKVERDTKENFKKGKKISDDSKISEIKTNSSVVEEMEVVGLDNENDNTPDIKSANAQENFQSEFQQNPENKINAVEASNINGDESADISEETESDIRECGADAHVNMESSARKESISRRKSPKAKKKKVSLPKTPDANTSQDSPVFRQLKNRSVKFSSKKKKK